MIKVQGLRFEIKRLGFGVYNLGLKVSDQGFEEKGIRVGFGV